MSWVRTYSNQWPNVTSEYAHRTVEAAFKLRESRQNHRIGDNPAYREWVSAKLRESELALLLPGGLDTLPDFFAAVPGWLKAFFPLARPRTLSGLVRHVVDNLDWYVDPTRPAHQFRFSPHYISLIAAVCMLLTTIELSPWFAFGFPFLLWIGFGLALGQTPEALKINAEEFYEYVQEAYRDAADAAEPHNLDLPELEHYYDLPEDLTQ